MYRCDGKRRGAPRPVNRTAQATARRPGSYAGTSPRTLHGDPSRLQTNLTVNHRDIERRRPSVRTWSSVIESSRSSTRCRPSLSSSSSSSSNAVVRPFPRSAPNAALPPANENGVDCTAVPNTLAVGDAPNALKSETTFRGGEAGATGFTGDVFSAAGRAGRYGEP